jgi:hypothetical protein
MAQANSIPEQHPAVVLRSHFVFVRALLAVAMIAVVGLTVAVVIVANDSVSVSTAGTAQPAGEIRYGGMNPATGRPETAPLPQRRLDGTTDTGLRYNGGPNEGSADIAPANNAPARSTERQAFPGQAQQAGEVSGLEAGPTRYDGGPNEGSPDVAPGRASVMPQSDGVRYDGGPEEGTRGPGN